MARKREPDRDIALEIYIKSKGTLPPKEIAEKLKLPSDKVRKWKSLDKWEEELKKKKRGAQPGNKNAKGSGAPRGNKNAEIHGAYSKIDIANLSEEDRAYIEAISLENEENLLTELRLLRLKEKEIRGKMEALNKEPEDTLYLSRVAEMYVAYSIEELEGLEPEEREKLLKELRLKMKTVTKESKFERGQKLITAYDKIHGRIIKLLDTIKSYHTDKKRLELDTLRYDLSKQKATGSIEVDPFDENEESEEK